MIYPERGGPAADAADAGVRHLRACPSHHVVGRPAIGSHPQPGYWLAQWPPGCRCGRVDRPRPSELRDDDPDVGIRQLAQSVRLSDVACPVPIENTAGESRYGLSTEAIARLWEALDGFDVGFCLTRHAWAGGMSLPEAAEIVLGITGASDLVHASGSPAVSTREGPPARTSARHLDDRGPAGVHRDSPGHRPLSVRPPADWHRRRYCCHPRLARQVNKVGFL